MRLDKFLSVTATATRSEAGKAARAGQITVNGVPVKKADVQIDPDKDKVTYCGTPVAYKQYHYVLLNKPDGYVSATEDGRDPTVLERLPPQYTAFGLFPCGRLDKHTLGLMLLTNDGQLAHRLLSPRNHVEKSYAFCVKFPLSGEDVAALESGVDIGGYVTKPSRVELTGEREGVIFITEGKYHQIKLMMSAVHNQITYLERLTFGALSLDARLARGEWRELTSEELAALQEREDTSLRGKEEKDS